MRRTHDRCTKSEAGTTVVGFVIMLTLVMLIIELIVVGGQLAGAQASVSNAAREAARRGTLVQAADQVWPVVDSVARANMAESGQDCDPVYVFPAGTEFAPGKQVVVEVTCLVKLRDFSVFGLPLPNKNVNAIHSETIETYRAFGVLNP